MAILNVTNYGAVGDGVADDTQAIRSALAAGEGNVIYFPPGIYKITGTLWLQTGCTIYGESRDSTKIILGNGYVLDPVFFRNQDYTSGPNMHPMITNMKNAYNVTVRNIAIEGNRDEILKTDWGMAGIMWQFARNAKVENSSVRWINIKDDLKTYGFGWNIISKDCDGVTYYNTIGEYAGYQPFGFADRTKNGKMYDSFSGMGLRTSTQVHRDCTDIEIYNNHIIQPSNPAMSSLNEPHAAVTLHGELGEEVRNVYIHDNEISLDGGHKAAIQAFRKSEGTKIELNTITSNAEGIRLGDAKNADARDNTITGTPNNVSLEYGRIGINVIDGTNNSSVKYNDISGFDTDIFKAESTWAIDEIEGVVLRKVRLFYRNGNDIMEMKQSHSQTFDEFVMRLRL